jgi:hypothetical protein
MPEKQIMIMGKGGLYMALKPNGKTEKAKKKIAAVNNEINDIVNKLQDVEKSLQGIIQTNVTGIPKQKSMIAILPKRIEFDLNHLHFYIDFTLMASENDTSVGIKGCIIYGVNRTVCFSECIYPKKLTKATTCSGRLSNHPRMRRLGYGVSSGYTSMISPVSRTLRTSFSSTQR